jgi:hypothetical protein
MVEVEGDKMFDLFSGKSRGQSECDAFGDPDGGFTLPGATEKRIESMAKKDVVKFFEELHNVPSSKSKSKSSTILTFELVAEPKNRNTTSAVFSRVNLVELSADVNLGSILECEDTQLPIIQKGDFISRMFYVSVNFDF